MSLFNNLKEFVSFINFNFKSILLTLCFLFLGSGFLGIDEEFIVGLCFFLVIKSLISFQGENIKINMLNIHKNLLVKLNFFVNKFYLLNKTRVYNNVYNYLLICECRLVTLWLTYFFYILFLRAFSIAIIYFYIYKVYFLQYLHDILIIEKKSLNINKLIEIELLSRNMKLNPVKVNPGSVLKNHKVVSKKDINYFSFITS